MIVVFDKGEADIYRSCETYKTFSVFQGKSLSTLRKIKAKQDCFFAYPKLNCYSGQYSMNLSESNQSFHHFLSLKHDFKKMREKSQVKKVD